LSPLTPARPSEKKKRKRKRKKTRLFSPGSRLINHSTFKMIRRSVLQETTCRGWTKRSQRGLFAGRTVVFGNQISFSHKLYGPPPPANFESIFNRNNTMQHATDVEAQRAQEEALQ
jgi:hypothetical protein